MRYYNTEGIIIKTRPLGEADKVYTILSANYGKFEAKVKSARNIKSKISGPLELFACCKFYFAKGKNLDIIINAATVNAHRNIRASLSKIAAGFYLIEVFNKTTEEREKDYKIYETLKEALNMLDRLDNVEVVLRAAETRLLYLLGYQMSLDECVSCRTKNEPLKYINVIMGGAICDKCYLKYRIGLTLYPAAKEVMKYFRKFDIKGISRLKLSEDVLKNIFKINTMFYMTHFDFKISSLDFLNRLKNEEKMECLVGK